MQHAFVSFGVCKERLYTSVFFQFFASVQKSLLSITALDHSLLALDRDPMRKSTINRQGFSR